jgi:hypothetical protein
MEAKMRLGLDIGRVLISPEHGHGGDTSFIGGTLETAVATPAYDGMFETVPQLVRHFEGRVWLVSKARPAMQEKTRAWLRHNAFFEKTGIPKGNLRFCFERHQKAAHCRQLRITHFVDDRLDVLEHLEGVVPNRFLFGPQRPGVAIPPDVVRLRRWQEAKPEMFH